VTFRFEDCFSFRVLNGRRLHLRRFEMYAPIPLRYIYIRTFYQCQCRWHFCNDGGRVKPTQGIWEDACPHGTQWVNCDPL